MKTLLPKLLLAAAVSALIAMALARGAEPRPTVEVEITKDPPTNAHSPETPIEWPKQKGALLDAKTNTFPAANANLLKEVEKLKAKIVEMEKRSETNVLYKVTHAVQLQTPDGLIYAISGNDLSNLVQLGIPVRWVPELIIHKRAPR